MNILITGASSGIGKALACHYLSRGNTVYGGGRNPPRLQQLADEYPQFHPLMFDVCDIQACRQLIGTIEEPLDLVILNAGNCEYVDGEFRRDVFQRMLETNFLSVVNCVESLDGRIRSGGQLALMSSSVTLTPLAGAEAYGASKAALDYLGKTLAVSLTPKAIDVSLIQPGFIITPLTRRNSFDMPFCLTAEQAAIRISKGLHRRKSLIRFPNRLIFCLKLLAWIPAQLRYKLFYGTSNS